MSLLAPYLPFIGMYLIVLSPILVLVTVIVAFNVIPTWRETRRDSTGWPGQTAA